jgi:tetratricopeptide (TPR) repeat protein
MFRLLGLHPGPDISVLAAASLAGTNQPEADRLLSELTRAHLITEHLPARYACHDLLRAYLRALALHREFGDRFHEADTLSHLGDTRDAAGELTEARDAWQQALDILDDLQHPGAEKVRAQLAAATPQSDSSLGELVPG